MPSPPGTRRGSCVWKGYNPSYEEAKGAIMPLFSVGKLIAIAFNASWRGAFLLRQMNYS